MTIYRTGVVNGENVIKEKKTLICTWGLTKIFMEGNYLAKVCYN